MSSKLKKKKKPGKGHSYYNFKTQAFLMVYIRGSNGKEELEGARKGILLCLKGRNIGLEDLI